MAASPDLLVGGGRGPMVPVPYALLRKRQDTADTWTLSLAPEGGSGGGLAFLPGQFTMLSAAGNGEVPISISGDPRSPGVLTHTVRAVGLATEAICAQRPGDVLGIRGPFGRGWPLQECEGADVAVIAGGIGLAPLRPAILSMLARRERFGRLVLLYGGRSPDQLLFTGEAEAWRRRGMEVYTIVDSAGPEWLGPVGVVTRLVHRAALDRSRTRALVCGPEVMMRFVVDVLAHQGIGVAQVHVSMERNMQCGIGHCGHCQLGPTLVCRDGPVYRWDELASWLSIREL